MGTRFAARLRQLRAAQNQFDADGAARTLAHLTALQALPLRQGKSLLVYHESLLFLRAHPANTSILRRVEAEFKRLVTFMKASRGQVPAAMQNEGLPYADTVTRFSHDCLRWLSQQSSVRVEMDEFVEPMADLNAVLRLTLPSTERSETTAGRDNLGLLDALRVPPAQRLAFVLQQCASLDAQPYVKDHLFDSLDMYVRVSPRTAVFSKAFNRLPTHRAVDFQTESLRHFDALALMNLPLPAPRALDAAARAQVLNVLKATMALTVRETDPATYTDANSLRVYDLERGISIALFGMTPDRQLPLESYVGFTLFKNGMPLSYGGSWLLGPRAAFGMNVFEPYRGGESGYVMCQLLRAYRQAFGIDYFEVDAHQFGLDNPDGIASGAFWFYYRYGFRPLDTTLARLAEREKSRMQKQPGYRSSEKTLLQFTQSNVALNFGQGVPVNVDDWCQQIGQMVSTRYAGDRAAAQADCVKQFVARTQLADPVSGPEAGARTEVALLAQALQISQPAQWRTLAEMVKLKPVDLDAYQALLGQLIRSLGQS